MQREKGRASEQDEGCNSAIFEGIEQGKVGLGRSHENWGVFRTGRQEPWLMIVFDLKWCSTGLLRVVDRDESLLGIFPTNQQQTRPRIRRYRHDRMDRVVIARNHGDI